MHSLVTGGGGFLGSYIVEALLARGDGVRTFGRGDYPKLRARGVEVVRGDIRDSAALAAACAGIECVFHCAALAGISMDRDEYESVNRGGTELLLANARRQGVKWLVYTSSPSVVFAGKDQCGVDESVPYDFGWMEANRAYYSYTKACAEQAVLAANGDELRTCALRPHLIWGPGDTHLVPRLLALARSGRLRRVGEGANLVDVTYVENAAEAHVRAADALAVSWPPAEAGSSEAGSSEAGSTNADSRVAETPAGKAYFISQGEPVNCWQWIDEILSLVNLPGVTTSLSYDRARWVGAACEALYRGLRLRGEPPMTQFLAAQLSMSHWFDISGARRDLGYEPRVSTADGMRRLGAWLRGAS
ncbi:MAG TPA: NAD-dependent epimerase/dehydratase family protein [Lacipirellulaceae bacterium]|nr:NAD-dependent epimerase/dehydratase family protein [Lacipirellulaceae bacterium]